MRVLLPVALLGVFTLVVKLARAEAHEAITPVAEKPPQLPAPRGTATLRPPAAEPVEDNRAFEPNAALPPPARPRGRSHYADPHTPPPTRVHPAERVLTTPPAEVP